MAVNGERVSVGTFRADDLWNWTGYLVQYDGEWLTIVSVTRGSDLSYVVVTMAYPSGTGRKPRKVELSRGTDVQVWR